jgi:hypothetical protein
MIARRAARQQIALPRLRLERSILIPYRRRKSEKSKERCYYEPVAGGPARTRVPHASHAMAPVEHSTHDLPRSPSKATLSTASEAHRGATGFARLYA